MKFGLKFVAGLAAAALAVRLYISQKDGLSFWAQSGKPAPAKIGQVHQDDPYATLEDSSGPLDGQSTDPITEAAYHQGATEWFPSMGSDENSSGEEVTSFQ